MNIDDAKKILMAATSKLDAIEKDALDALLAELSASKERKDTLSREEIWRDIEGFAGMYQISNLGRVRSRKQFNTWVIRKPVLSNHGYYELFLMYGNGKKKHFFIHVLIAKHFIPNPDGKPIVNHKNGIKTDNRVENLEWVTYSENTRHAYKTGLHKRALDKETQQFIRENYIRGSHTYGAAALAKSLGLHEKTLTLPTPEGGGILASKRTAPKVASYTLSTSLNSRVPHGTFYSSS